MSALSKVLRGQEGGRLTFMCPGCNMTHTVAVGQGSGPRWEYNNDPVKPTFNPSVLATVGHYIEGYDGQGCYCNHPDEEYDFHCYRCHSFVKDGMIQFLDDCSHDLKNQTVPLTEWTEYEN